VVYDNYGNAVNNTVTITITDDTPTATANTNSVNEGDTATGNVLTDGTPDTFGADGAKTTSPVGGVIGFKTGSDTSTPATSNIGTEVTGTYGKLTLNADGSRSSATLTITVNDAASPNTAPVNTVPGAQTIDEDTTLTFTSAGGNLISVNDADGNLASTQLTVTNSKLSVDLTGTGATISAGASNSATLTLIGTQTVAQLTDGKVVFIHDGSETLTA